MKDALPASFSAMSSPRSALWPWLREPVKERGYERYHRVDKRGSRRRGSSYIGSAASGAADNGAENERTAGRLYRADGVSRRFVCGVHLSLVCLSGFSDDK